MTKHTIILSICFLMFLTGCATVPSGQVTTTPITYGKSLKNLCERYDIAWQWDSVSQVITLDYQEQTVSALVGSDVVLIGEEQVTLSKPIKTVRSAIIVPDDFQSKVINRLRRASRKVDYSIRKVNTVIIDAGHGGKDPGAIGHSGLKEKKVVLDIARRLKRLLEKKGIKTIMTRPNDTFISLQERTEIASHSKADLFVSIHANASHSKQARGVEIFTLKNLSRKDMLEEQRVKNEKTLFNALNMKKNKKDLKLIINDMLYDNKQAESKKFADDFTRNITRVLQAKNRGHKESRFFVLRNTLIPSVLVEVGFLSNPGEERLLKSSKYRQRIAYSIAMSILDYANWK